MKQAKTPVWVGKAVEGFQQLMGGKKQPQMTPVPVRVHKRTPVHPFYNGHYPG